jgi:2-(1,2-epoxy-1,2-dihydrophenyl)acetyl-CoA isomerase
MNAISVEMLTALGQRLTEYDRDSDVRAIVLTGEGRGFGSGLDLKDTAAVAVSAARSVVAGSHT